MDQTHKEQILLTQLRSLVARDPDFNHYSPSSQKHQEWLGEAHNLISRWEPELSSNFIHASNMLGFSTARSSSLATIFGDLHRAISELEFRRSSAPSAGQAFGPGAIYDFYKALKELLASARQSLLIADPYIDDTIFDSYLIPVPKPVKVRLLVHQYAATVKTAAAKFVAQHELSIEIRSSKNFHDRVLFLDANTCWVLGQSIKDAAVTKPTYLAPLSADIASLKLSAYEHIWNTASVV